MPRFRRRLALVLAAAAWPAAAPAVERAAPAAPAALTPAPTLPASAAAPLADLPWAPAGSAAQAARAAREGASAAAGPAPASASAADAAGGMAAGVAAPRADAAGVLGEGFDGLRRHVCAACAAAEAAMTPPELSGAAPLRRGRLPDSVHPHRYDLRLRIDPAQGSFSGVARVEAEITRPTDVIVLNALDLSFTRIKVDGRAVDSSRVVIDPAAETVTIRLDSERAAGRVELELAYDGRTNELMRGLFKAVGSHAGKPEAWAFTHLEPTHARRVLPSFDEPRFKATYKLTLDAPEELVALSNMPAISERREGGRRVVEFDETPAMSSYLLAVYAARLAPKSRKVGGTLVTVWAMPEQLEQADFALDVAQNALKELSAYFGTPYQLPKLDLVVAPEFASGAMENWGAILFRDSSLLVDAKRSSEAARRRVADVVTHEIAHQWFGNLVTMKDWPDLWLNEAFATWLSAKIVDRWKPAWKMWEDFDRSKRGPLAVDALPGATPIQSEAATPAEIQALFNGATYDKGGALLRMIETWIGEDAFRDGIRSYLRAYAHGNAEAADLWRELERASGKPVSRLGDGWLKQAGAPLLSVEAASPDGRSLRLTQRRFAALGSLGEQRWVVPVEIRYRLEGEAQPRRARALLDGPETVVELPGRGKLLWAYPNADEIGYYRLSLDDRLLAAALANRAQLSAAERSGWLNHLWASVRAGTLPAASFLDTLAAFKDDPSHAVLEDAAGYLKTLRQELAASDEQRAALARFAESYFGPHARRLGWTPKPGESEDDSLARPAVLAALALLSPGSKALSEVPGLVAAYLEDPSRVPASVALVALTAAARGGDAALFQALRERLADPRSPEQKDQMLRALAEFTAPELLDRYLAMTLSDEIRAQDGWKPFTWLLANPAARERTWAFVKAHWPALVGKLGPRGATRIVGAAAGLVSAEGRRDVESFFGASANDIEMARKTLAQALSSIDLGLSFQAAQRASFEGWAAASRPRLWTAAAAAAALAALALGLRRRLARLLRKS